MITTQADLDRCLDRVHTVQVGISPDGPLPQGRAPYAPLLALPQQGFSFTPRELLHAIGCKTAALPMSARDECLKSAWLYTNIFDLEGPHLSFQGAYGSDLQIARSQEVGIGMMCLMVERYFGIPWDQLGPLPGRGKRFDYRGTNGPLQCIVESKGTSHRSYQGSQIDSGLEKKTAHHARGEHFDVELIISSCISHNGDPPHILLADPDTSSIKHFYERGDNRYFRLRPYCRVLQYVGLPRSAFHLNRYSREYLENRRSIYRTIMDEKQERGYLSSIRLGGDEFLFVGSGLRYLDYFVKMLPWHVSQGFTIQPRYTTSSYAETEGRKSFSARKTVSGSTFYCKRASSVMDTASMPSV